MNPASKAEALDRAYAEYLAKAAALAAITQCLSHWPSDLPWTDYPGTQCDLLDGHPGAHRHRMYGSATVVTW